MFTLLSTSYPALGKEAELLAHGTEFVKARQARGEAIALARRLYSPIGPAITLVRRFNDLGEAEAALEARQTDPHIQASLAQANALSRAPMTVRLREVIIPAERTGEAKFVAGVTLYPAPGNISAVQALVGERVRSQQARVSTGLAVDLFDPDGQSLVVSVFHPSLSAYDEFRRANQADPAFIATAAEVSKLVRKPATTILNAVVVPMPQ